MSGKDDFKEKARSNSQVGPNIPAKVSIRWYGAWKRNGKHISDFINNRTLTHPEYDKTLKSLLGSKEIEINFEEGAAVDFEPPRKVIPDVKSHVNPNIVYVFYDAGDESSYKAAKKFIKEQCNAPASNPREKTARKNICLIADSSKSHHRGPVVGWDQGELVKNLHGIQFYQCSSVDSIQEIITKSLEEYAISVLSPEEGKKIAAAKKVMENVCKDIERLKQPPTYNLPPQELLGILKELAAIRESIETNKAYCLDDAGQKFVEREILKLESFILERVYLAFEAGDRGPACPSELYHLYVECCDKNRYWERQVSDCWRVIEENQNKFLAQSKSDTKASTNENVKRAVVAYKRFAEIIAKLQTIANGCASSPKGFRRGSQAEAIKKTTDKIKWLQENCKKMLSDFLFAVEKKIAADVEDIVSSIREPDKADFKDLEKCNDFRKICQFFQEVIPPLKLYLEYHEVVSQRKLLNAITLSLKMLDDESLKKSYGEYLKGASRSLKELSKFCADFNALKNLTLEEILNISRDMMELDSKLAWIKNKINKYKILYNDRREKLIEEEYLVVEASVKELISRVNYAKKLLNSQEILAKPAEGLAEIEIIEKRFSALTTLGEVLQLLGEAKIFEKKILEIQGRIEDHRRLCGNVDLEAITASLAKTETNLQAVRAISDSLRQIMAFNDRLMVMVATQESLQPLSGEPALEEISEFIDTAMRVAKSLSSMGAELEGWSLMGKSSPLDIQFKKSLQYLKEKTNRVIGPAKIKFMALSYTKLLKTLSEVSETKELEEQCKKISQAEQLKNGLAGLQITDISNKDVLPRMLGKAKEKIVETVEALIFPYSTLLNELNGKVAEASTMEECCKVFDRMEEVGKNLIKIQQASPDASDLAGISVCLAQREKIIGRLTEKMKGLMGAQYADISSDDLVKVSSIGDCYRIVKKMLDTEKGLKGFQQKYPTVSELIGVPAHLNQVTALIARAVEKTKEAVRVEYAGKPGDMSDVFRSHGSGGIMTKPILYDDGYSYDQDDKPKAGGPEIKQVARNHPLESLIDLYKPKEAESGISENKSVGAIESKAVSFEGAAEHISCPLEIAIVRKPIMAIINEQVEKKTENGEVEKKDENVGRIYENSKEALGLTEEPETRKKILSWFQGGNKALESFIKALLEKYPQQLDSVLKDWKVNKGNAVEILKWLISLRISFAEKKAHIAVIYKKGGLTDEFLSREYKPIEKAVEELSNSLEQNRLALLINIQKDELPYLRELASEAKKTAQDAASIENIKDVEMRIEYLTTNVDTQIREIIRDNAARYQASGQQAHPSVSSKQQAPSSSTSSHFHVQRVSEDKLTVAPHAHARQIVGDAGASSETTSSSYTSLQPAGDGNRSSSSANQPPVGGQQSERQHEDEYIAGLS